MAHLRIPTDQHANTHQIVYEDFPPSSDWTHDANCHVLLIDLPGFKREELKVRVDNFRKVTVSGERQLSENRFSRFKQVYEMPEDADIDSITGRFDGGLLFVIIPKKKQTLVTQEIEEEKMPSKELEKSHEHVHENTHEKKEEIHEQPRKEEKPREEEPRKNEDTLRSEKTTENKRDKGKEGLGGERRRKFEEEWRKQVAERVKTKEEYEIIMRNAMEKVRKNKNMIITAVLAFSLGLYVARKL